MYWAFYFDAFIETEILLGYSGWQTTSTAFSSAILTVRYAFLFRHETTAAAHLISLGQAARQ